MAKSFKYKLLMQHLMVSINAGEFSIGSRLPTEKELATQYQVSIQTVRQAMLQLKQNGIIRQVSGSGTFLLRRPGMQTMESAETKAQVHNIGVVVWNTSIHVFPRLIHSIEQEVFQSGRHLVTCSSDDQPDQERLIFERLVQQGISGLIVSPILWSHDLSVVSFDNSHVARSHFPIGLDSIDYPAEEMGLSAVQELLACMGQDRWVAKGIMLEPELIIRQSSAPPAGARRKATATA